MEMTFIDFFAGIGGFHSGFEKAGMKCIGWCEFDKYAQKSYRAIYDTEGLWFKDDVRKVRGWELPRAAVWTFGFPCQDVSIAGKQKGIKRGTRSGLFLRLCGSLMKRKKINPDGLSLKTLKICYLLRGGGDSSRCFLKWKNEGTVSNGKCTTQKTTEYLRTEKECTLLDILEKQVDDGYYLKPEKVKELLKSYRRISS